MKEKIIELINKRLESEDYNSYDDWKLYDFVDELIKDINKL